MHDLRCRIFSAPLRGRKDRDLHSVYALWTDVWSRTLAEIDPNTILVSDKFSSQDEVVSLFIGDDPVAAGTLKVLDLKHDIDRRDSFFEPLPQDFSDRLLRSHARIMVGGYLTIASSARGFQSGLPTTEVLVGLMVRRFQESGADVLVATMRSDIPAYATAVQLGARIAATTEMHNVPVVVITAMKSAINSNPNALVDQLIDELWENRNGPSVSRKLERQGIADAG